jgi:hypothetical protein
VTETILIQKNLRGDASWFTVIMIILSFPLVGNPSLEQKDTGQAGMTENIPRSFASG